MPAQVDFHTGVAEPVPFACRLLRKAYTQGATLVVRAPAATLGALDRALWLLEPQGFVPHLRIGRPAPDAAALRRTPIWLAEGEAPQPGPPILVNLGGDVGPGDGRFERLIEIVGTDAGELQAARRRWRQYEQLGWPIRHHAAAAAGGPAVG
ncbi:MAG: DNA polymerase III subunit chi [Burkholderiales bacterium]|nr:DNA polymerase III subunit chi [Burkholderiales bacterium]